MINAISIHSEYDRQTFYLKRLNESDNYAVINIAGITPGDADIGMMDAAYMDGKLLGNRRINDREIELTLRLLDGDAERQRNRSYLLFPLKRRVRMEIHSDYRHSYIDGYVKKCSSNVFSQEEELNVVLSCPFPFFTDLETADANKILEFSSVTELFEFPFSNESLTAPLLEFGSIKRKEEVNLYYPGEVENACIVIFKAVGGDVVDPELRNVDYGQRAKVFTNRFDDNQGPVLHDGDSLWVCSQLGNKYVVLNRATGAVSNQIQAYDISGNWIILQPGDNRIRYFAKAGSEYLSVEIRHTILYSGA